MWRRARLTRPLQVACGAAGRAARGHAALRLARRPAHVKGCAAHRLPIAGPVPRSGLQPGSPVRLCPEPLAGSPLGAAPEGLDLRSKAYLETYLRGNSVQGFSPTLGAAPEGLDPRELSLALALHLVARSRRHQRASIRPPRRHHDRSTRRVRCATRLPGRRRQAFRPRPGAWPGRSSQLGTRARN